MGTELTTTITGDGLAAVFVALDHGSAEWVGIHAHARATRYRPWSRSARACGSILAGSKAIARTPAVRHDHGSRYISDHLRKELTVLGIESSPVFLRSPKGHGCAERFIPTLTENLRWVRRFKTVAGCGRRRSLSRKSATTPG